MNNPQLPRLILASASPRRRELLEDAGYDFDVIPPNHDVETGICSNCSPAELVTQLAYRKATAVRDQLRSQPSTPQPLPIIVAADTVAECDGFILGKPRDENHARQMLRQLSGRDHRVLTGVCLIPNGGGEPIIRVAVTKLRMDELTDDQLEDYLSTGGWQGKAGAFGYQDRLGWVRVTEGSESNVVGLPMEMLAEMLQGLASGAERESS